MSLLFVKKSKLICVLLELVSGGGCRGGASGSDDNNGGNISLT